MKLADVKARIDAHFEAVAPQEVVRRLEVLGFEFRPYFGNIGNVTVERQADDIVADFSVLAGKQDVQIDASLFQKNMAYNVEIAGDAAAGGNATYAMAA